MKRQEFIQLAITKGLPKEKIKVAMDRRRTEIGAFDDDEPEAAPAAAATPDFMAPNPIPGIPGMGGENLPPVGAPPRPPDLPAPPMPESPSLSQKLMPNLMGPKATSQMPTRDPDGNVTGHVPVQGGSPALETLSDVGSLATRTAGAAIPSAATRGKNADGSTKSFGQAMADPETGVGRAAREYLGDVIEDKIGKISKGDRNILQRYLDMQVLKMAAAGYTAVSILEDPTVIITGIAKAGIKGLEHLAPKLKNLVQATSKLPGESLERAAKDLPAVRAAAETQPNLATDIGDQVVNIRQQNTAEHQALEAADQAKHESEVNRLTTGHEAAVVAQDAKFTADTDAARRGLETGVAKERPGQPLINPAAVDPYRSGKSLETAAVEARKAIGEKHGTELSKAFHQSGISSQPVPEQIKFGHGHEADGRFIPKRIMSNPLTEFIDESLRRAGYDQKKKYQGNESISKSAVEWALQRKDFASNQRTLGQVLKFRKNFQDQLFKDSGGPTPMFPRSGQGANDYRFLKSMYDESNNLIGELPKRYLPEAEAAKWTEAWSTINKDYAEPIGALEDIAEGLGKFADPEDFMKKIKDMGADSFKKFNQAAAKHPEMKKAVDEMRQMTFDNMLRLSLDTKNGNAFDAQKFVNHWNSEYRDNRELLREALGSERTARINGAVQKFKLPEKPGAIAKPEMPAKPDKLPAQEPAFPRLAGRKELPDDKTILSTVSNIGNKPNIFALKELEFLDNVLGLKGKERFTERALDAFAAKELGIGKDGIVPNRNLQRTGFATGSRVAGTASGASIGWLVGHYGFGRGGTGAAIGAYLGQGAGARVTSPASAISAYKALNKLEGVAKSKKAVQLLKAATKTQSAAALSSLSAQLERELVNPNLIPFRKVAQDSTVGEERYGGEPVEVPARR